MILQFRAAGLLWRPVGILVRFVLVLHPLRGAILPMSEDYRNAVRRRVAACHRHIQLGLIAQGLLHILPATKPKLVWLSLGSWIRTVRQGPAPPNKTVLLNKYS